MLTLFGHQFGAIATGFILLLLAITATFITFAVKVLISEKNAETGIGNLCGYYPGNRDNGIVALIPLSQRIKGVWLVYPNKSWSHLSPCGLGDEWRIWFPRLKTQKQHSEAGLLRQGRPHALRFHFSQRS